MIVQRHSSERCMMGVCWGFCVIVCGGVLVCMFVWMNRFIMGVLVGIFVGCSVTYIRDQMKTMVVWMHGINHSCMDYLTNAQSLYVVESGARILWKDIRIQCASVIRMKYIIHIMGLFFQQFFCVYHAVVFGGEWIHGTCRGREVCNVLILVEDRSGFQLCIQ